jgi:MFS family permease
MQVTAVVFLLGSAIEAFAASPVVMGIGRTVNGFGAGAATVIVPIYISEVAPPQSRGFFGAFTQISTNIGILFTQTLGYFLSYGSAWRWIMGVGAVVAAAHGMGLFVVPESPAWMAAHRGEVTKARAILERIRGSKATIDDEVAAWGSGAEDDETVVGSEHQGLLSGGNLEAGAGAPSVPVPHPAGVKTPAGHIGFWQVVRDPFYRPAIISVVGIMFAQQICGINSIIMYSVSLLNGLLPINSALVTIIISAINLVTTAACSPLPDRLGRKTCILLSVAGQGSSSLGLALSILFGLKTLSAVFVLFFVASFALGLGPVPFIMASELVGQEAVGAVQSWSLAANYVATFIVAQFFPIVNTALNEAFGGAGYVYFLFAAAAAFWFVFISAYVPETLGRKDADEVWGRTRRID